jgi:peroxiredoxin Q/BCP
MLELREFRARHAGFERIGVPVAAIGRESPAASAPWAKRLRLPYPVLSDEDGAVGRALLVHRPFVLGGWSIDLFHRTTFLVDRTGLIAAVWGKVKMRGHAQEVLTLAGALTASA